MILCASPSIRMNTFTVKREEQKVKELESVSERNDYEISCYRSGRLSKS